MKVSDFDFDLPASAIAQRPAVPRDAARLLQVSADALEDKGVRDLPDLLAAGDLLIANDTAVIPARLYGYRGEVAVEVTLLEESEPGHWRALAKKAKRLHPGDTIRFAAAFSADVMEKHPDGSIELVFDRFGEDLAQALDRYGAAPLPPYIRRTAPDARDRADYQTLFAQRPGAVAAPTAGLHFTPDLLDALAARGIRRTTITLHVGAGTFLPIKGEQVGEHVMHAERGEIGVDAADAIAETRSRGGRIVAIGTTVLRLLEAAAAKGGPKAEIRPWRGATDLFLIPGHRFRTADRLITNFHLPRSTLFMLVCAFAGTTRMKAAYAHAIGSGYRFYSYGDACLLDRAEAP